MTTPPDNDFDAMPLDVKLRRRRNAVLRTCRVLIGKRKPHEMQLKDCLIKLHVATSGEYTRIGGKRRYSVIAPRDASEGLLWDLFEKAKAAWLHGVKLLHPDIKGANEACTIWNAIWQRCKELFRRRGLPV